MNIRVPYGMSVHDHEEINAIIKTLNTSTQMGVNVRLFEKKIQIYLEKKYTNKSYFYQILKNLQNCPIIGVESHD